MKFVDLVRNPKQRIYCCTQMPKLYSIYLEKKNVMSKRRDNFILIHRMIIDCFYLLPEDGFVS